MSYENYPKVDDTADTSPYAANKKNNNGKNVIIGLLGAALLGSFGYIYYVNDKASNSIAQKDGIINATSTEKDALQAELNEASAKYDELQSLDAKKDSSLTAKDLEISSKRAEIQKILSKANASKEELATAKGLIRSLNGTINGYKEEIAALKQKNTLLTYEKDSVIVERETARGERDKYRNDYDSTTKVVKQKESVIDVASTLHASNFNIAGINEKSGGKEVSTTKAKKVDKLRISFEIDENRVTQSGKKDLFVSITAPDGTPVSVQALGSGTFTTRDGKDLPYTQKISLDYIQSSKQNVQFDWKQNTDFQKGNYKIEVYNNGFKIGEGFRELRKGGLFG
jgi:hypothetical protein